MGEAPVQPSAPGDEREAEGRDSGPGVHGERHLLAFGQVGRGDEDPCAAARWEELDARLALGEPRGAGSQGCFELDERGDAGRDVQHEGRHLAGLGGGHERAPVERGPIEPFPGGGRGGEEEQQKERGTRTHARPQEQARTLGDAHSRRQA
jgi:hypothetical protein